MSMFSTPAAPGDGVKLADHLGSLLLIEPLSVEEGFATVHGVTTVVRCNISVVDGPGKDTVYDDTLLFSKILVSQTRTRVGEKVLGRLDRGTAKPGQSAPWVLNQASQEDIAKAEAWVKAQGSSSITSAAPPF